jgi:hypothetical protein
MTVVADQIYIRASYKLLGSKLINSVEYLYLKIFG